MTSALQRAAAEEKRTQPTLRVATLGRPELEQPSVTIELRFKTGGRLLKGFVFDMDRALFARHRLPLRALTARLERPAGAMSPNLRLLRSCLEKVFGSRKTKNLNTKLVASSPVNGD